MAELPRMTRSGKHPTEATASDKASAWAEYRAAQRKVNTLVQQLGEASRARDEARDMLEWMGEMERDPY